MIRSRARLVRFWPLFAAVAVVTAAAVCFYWPGDKLERSLRRAGFPPSYAKKLADLQRRRPDWRFVPLKVSELEPRYTWKYCIDQETDAAPSRSLVSGAEKYRAYRHESGKAFDSGFIRASVATVEHFMDPRNFLSERDVFQFMDLAYDPDVKPGHVSSLLRGTFMAGMVLENDVPIEKYLVDTGAELGVNALHLAARLRQEQGTREGPLVSGRCGEKLAGYIAGDVQREGRFEVLTPRWWQSVEAMAAYDGLYNFFNIEASGEGRFAIYLAGIKEAAKGTGSKKDEWGGSGRWDARWKAIYGGAEKIATHYVGNRQNTLYLQKWNVDARSRNAKGQSRNFWGQYMQNVMAARNEARQMYRSLEENGALDLPYVFLVPVYGDMPETACADPGALE